MIGINRQISVLRKNFEQEEWESLNQFREWIYNKCRVYNIRNSKKVQSQGDCPNRIHSDQTILRIVRREAEPCERWPKALKTKLTQGGPSGSSPLRSDGSRYGQAGAWTALTVAKALKGRVGKQL